MKPGNRNLLIGLSLAITGGFLGLLVWVLTAPPPPPPAEPAPAELHGLELLPAEAGVVIEADLAAIRKFVWLDELLAGSPTEQEQDYREFVESTGFDYATDLDQLSLAVYGSGNEPLFSGIAEGRFQQDRIIAHAERYGGSRTSYQGYDIIQVEDPIRVDNPAIGEQVGSFAFAFLREGQLAVGTDFQRVQVVIDVLTRKHESLASDAARVERLRQTAGASQIWFSNDLSRWIPAQLGGQDNISPLIRELSGGVKIQEDGIQLRLAATCHQEEQAARLHTQLKFASLAAGLLLKRSDLESVRSLGNILGSAKFFAAERLVEARLQLSPAELKTLAEQAVADQSRTAR